jgi:hypothetical protein
MNILTSDSFRSKKQHSKLAIFGTGYSINYITPDQWVKIETCYDTLGINWMLKLKKPMTWYIVREQCATPKRIEPGHTLNDFIELMAYQKNACKIVKDIGYQKNNYQHAKNINNYEGDGYIFNEIRYECDVKSFKHSDMFKEGIHHGRGTIWDALHFAIQMNYEEIIFGGIDLYDNRYFYLGYDEILEQVKNEGRDQNSPHLLSKRTLKIVQDTIEYYKLPMATINPKSTLNTIMPVWNET